jgi:hypothetical protein
MFGKTMPVFAKCAAFCLAALIVGCVGGAGMPASGQTSPPVETKTMPAKRNYTFDRTLSREVLENYLSRAISVEGVFNGRGDLDDNIRFLHNTGAKYIGRAVCLWGGEANLVQNLARAKEQIPKLHAADPDMIVEACIFEIVTPGINNVPVPDWAFAALNMPVEKRNFKYDDIVYATGSLKNHWGNGGVPDISRPETKLLFYYLAASYIDMGVEGIHWGQVELMNKNDKDLTHYAQVLQLVRDYAAKHARRHMILCNAHVPSGGFLRGDQLLMDFHAFPLRIKETPDKPMDAILEAGHLDSLFNRSKGGISPSGWKCDHLPYLVELDNYGNSGQPEKLHPNTIWVWGYDEITWFAHHTQEYRAAWLRYAWDWLAKTDPNGRLQMPGSRTMSSPRDGKRWYYAHNPSPATPEGLGDEDAIKAIWAADTK